MKNFLTELALNIRVWLAFLPEILMKNLTKALCASGKFTGRELRKFIPLTGVAGLLFFTDAQTFRLVATMIGMVLMLGVAAHVSRRILFSNVDMRPLFLQATNAEKPNPEATKIYVALVFFQLGIFIVGAMLLS